MQYDLCAHGSGLDQREAAQIGRKQCTATSMYQDEEWDMHASQSRFPRMKDTIIYEENNERKIMLKAMILLFNFRTNVVGINQSLIFSSLGLSTGPWLVMK